MAKASKQQISSLIERLTRMIRAGEHMSDLNPAQWEALRYLSRCNKLSNSPGAVTRYLSATKGTVSQTLIALERKGLIDKTARAGDARSVELALTKQGRAKLAEDPWKVLDETAGELGDKTTKRLLRALDDLVALELTKRGGRRFGTCRSCRFFREKGADSKHAGPHLCLLADEPLSKSDTRKICVEFEPD